MSRSRKILLVVCALAALLVLFAFVHALADAGATRPAHADDGGFIVHVPGPDLEVTDTGPPGAPALVLLHGWTESLHIWDPVMSGLGPNLHVIRIDLIGHGGSEAPNSGYSIPDQALQVARVLDVLKVRGATLAGHSMGGDVAVQLAASRPDLVSRLIVIDAPTAPGYTHLSLMVRSSLWPVIGPFAHDYLPDGMNRLALRIAVAPGHDVPQQMVSDLHQVPWPAYEKSFFDTGDWIAEEVVPNRLRSIGKPTLIIWGARDQLVSPSAVALFSGLARTTITVLPGVGHTPPLEAPATTANLIRSFATAP